MDYVEIRERAAYLARQAGYTEAMPQPDWPFLTNRALEDFSWAAEYHMETASLTSVINQAEYDLGSPGWKSLTDCLWGTSGILLPTTEATVMRWNPLWIVEASGTPTWYWLPNTNTIRLHPKPSTTSVTYVRGIRTATPLVNDTDIPAFPPTWHEALACHAAYLHLEAFTGRASESGDMAQIDIARMDRYEAAFQKMAKQCFAWTQSDNVQTQRRVLMRGPDRMWAWPAFPRYAR